MANTAKKRCYKKGIATGQLLRTIADVTDGVFRVDVAVADQVKARLRRRDPGEPSS